MVFNSALVYEMAVLKPFAEPLFSRALNTRWKNRIKLKNSEAVQISFGKKAAPGSPDSTGGSKESEMK